MRGGQTDKIPGYYVRITHTHISHHLSPYISLRPLMVVVFVVEAMAWIMVNTHTHKHTVMDGNSA